MGFGRTLAAVEMAEGNVGIGAALMMLDRTNVSSREVKPRRPVTEQERLDDKAAGHAVLSLEDVARFNKPARK